MQLIVLKGWQRKKYHALFKPYLSQVIAIEKYGYAAKQLYHIWRLKDILEKYVNQKSYLDCLTPSELLRELLIDIKSYNYIFSPNEAESSALRAMDAINKLTKDFTPATVNEKTGELMDKVMADVIRKALKKELMEG